MLFVFGSVVWVGGRSSSNFVPLRYIAMAAVWRRCSANMNRCHEGEVAFHDIGKGFRRGQV